MSKTASQTALSRRKVLRAGVGTLAGFGIGGALAGCQDLEDRLTGKSARLQGQRYTILDSDSAISAKGTAAANKTIVLGRPFANPSWTHQGIDASQSITHLALNDQTTLAWSQSMGRAGGSRAKMMTRALIVGSAVYTMDATGSLSALRLQDGSVYWRQSLKPNKDKGNFGGGLAYDQGKLFVTNGTAYLLALDAQTGQIIWTASLKGLARFGAVAAQQRVFVCTMNNFCQTFDQETGALIWEDQGDSSNTRRIGGSGAAYADGTLYVAHGSGELRAFEASSGRIKWDEVLLPFGARTDVLSSIPDPGTAPVVDRGIVFLTSGAGRTAAFNTINGRLVWENGQGGRSQPVFTPSHMFLITNRSQLVAIDRLNGKFVWQRKLPEKVSLRRRAGFIQWLGPILANGRVFIFGSNGVMVSFNALDGKYIAQTDLGHPIVVEPSLAQKTLFLQTDDGRIHAYR